MRFVTYITSLICCLFFSVQSQSQIEIFGVSFGMSNEEIILEFDRKGYHGYYFDDLGIPTPCVYGDRLVHEECSRSYLNNRKRMESCSYELKSVRDCSIQTGSNDRVIVQDQCSGEFDLIRRCIGGTGNNFDVQFHVRGNEYDTIYFGCEVFNGCDYNPKEIIRFLIDNIGDQLTQSSGVVVLDEFEDSNLTIDCMTGLEGDQVCVEGYPEGSWIYLSRHEFGRSEMTLSLD